MDFSIIFSEMKDGFIKIESEKFGGVANIFM